MSKSKRVASPDVANKKYVLITRGPEVLATAASAKTVRARGRGTEHHLRKTLTA